MSDEKVLARITASTPRRFLGVGMLVFLGGLLIYMAFAAPPSLLWQACLLGFGAGSVWFAMVMYRATETELELTETELRDTAGIVLAYIADVQKVDRGAFALKPSNGFTLTMNRPQARCWRPGLWWRLGRRVAVGGVTSGALTRPVADVIATIIAQRDQP